MSNKKLWGGAFSESATPELEEFWGSISFDYRLAPFDIQGSIAHATMLGETGIITGDESKKIVDGLKSIFEAHGRGEIEFRPSDEDIHMNIERLLTERIGPVAGKLHTARSRNDQVALDMHLFARDAADKNIALLTDMVSTLVAKAEENVDAIMPGYTHMQRGQPISFAHHLMAYAWMFNRDIKRMKDVRESASVSPLGAGALAGTTFPINRQRVAELLSLKGVYANSMDSVSNRDFVVELLSANALVAAHMSRLCEEVILWVSSEFGFVRLSDKYCTGSSMMPQKKNADLAELVRGKTGRVYGSLVSMLTVLKGTPLTYNKDFQEDKEPLFDSCDTVQKSLYHLTGMMADMKARPDKMLQATKEGFLNATDVADYLAKKGMPFRETHDVAARIVAHCFDAKKTINDMTLAEFKTFDPKFEQDIFEAIDIENVVNRRQSYGGTSKSAVLQQIGEMKQVLDAHKKCAQGRAPYMSI